MSALRKMALVWTIAAAAAVPHATRAQDPLAEPVRDPFLSQVKSPVELSGFQENFQPYSGQMALRLTTVNLAGRAGLDLVLTPYYGSEVWNRTEPSLRSHVASNDTAGNLGGGGWQLHFGKIFNPEGTGSPSSTTRDNPYLVMPDGSTRIFYDEDAFLGGTYVSEDRWTFEKTGFQTFAVTALDGTRYDFTYAGEVEKKTRRLEILAQCTRVVDVHGNEITISYENGRPTTVTDSVGRVVQLSYVSGTDRLQYVDVKNQGSQLQRWQFKYPSSPMLTWDNGPVDVFAPNELVPPQGNSWLFEYYPSTDPSNGGTMLKKITLPTGGTITYTWAPKNFNAGCQTGAVVERPVIATRVTGGRDVTAATWTYTYSAPGSDGSETKVQATAPAGLNWSETYVTDGYGGTFVEFDPNLWKVGRVRSKTTATALETVVETPLHATGELLSPNYRYSSSWYACGNNRKSAQVRFAEPVSITREVTRGATSWTTVQSLFDDYGNPELVEEEGEVVRTTTLSWWYSASNHILEGRLATRVQTPGARETFTYNSNGALQRHDLNHTSGSTSNGVTTSYLYDSFGQRTQAKTINSLSTDRIVNYKNYSFAFPELEEHPPSGAPGGTINLTRDMHALGVVAWEKDGRTTPANQVTYGHDSWGRRTSIDPTVGLTTSIAYAPDGSTITVSRGSGADLRSTVYSFDGFGRFRGRKDVQRLDESIVTYDALGRRTQEQLKAGGVTADKWSFDVLGRVTEVLHPGGTKISAGYTAGQVTITDEEFASTIYRYEAFGTPGDRRLESVTDALGKTWSFDYHASYNLLTQITGPVTGSTRTFTYSTKQFLQSETHPETGTITYALSGAGDRISTTKGGQTVSSKFDHMARRYELASGLSEEVDFVYDAAGLPTTIASSEASYAQTWDGDQRLTQRTATIASRVFASGYQWDGHDRLTKVTYPSGRQVVYEYDSKGRIDAVTSPTDADWISLITYKNHGAVDTISLANGAFSTFTYDSRLRPTFVDTQAVDLDVDYDDANRIDYWSSDGLSRNFGYDSLGRLTAATGALGESMGFTYSELGNRKTQTIDGVTETYAYTSTNQRLTGVTGGYVSSYGYDSAGRLTSATGRSMTWTKLDRMKTATVGTTNASYGYDGEGRRVRSTVDGAARYFVLDPWGNVLAEYDGSGTLLVEHVYLDGRRIGSHYSNGERAYYQQDAVGSAWIVTSKTGGTYDVYRYQPFGDAVDQFDVAFASLASFEIAGADIPIFLDGFESGTTAAWITCDTGGCAVVPEDLIEPRFTDKELDLETGLFYFEARYLDSRIGRFTSPDPGPLNHLDPQSLNRYAYAGNSPYKYRDPDGRVLDTVLDVGFIAYDVFDIARSAIRGDGVTGTQWAALGADVGGALIPFATGGGAAIRAAAHADDLARAGRMLDNALSGGRSVLGHHPEYLKVASDLGAKRFDVPESIWKAMSEPERWAANRKFLDRAIARSDDIVLATPLEQMRPGSYFAREVDYLLEKGYKLSKDGTRLLPGK